MNTTTSMTLLESLRGGGSTAWDEFFRRYGPMLMAFARKSGLSDADAHDAVQDVLIAVLQQFARLTEPFDRSRRPFRAWLRGVARNKIRDIRRRCRREGPGGHSVAEDAAADELLDAVFEDEWQRALLLDCLREVAQRVDPAVYQAFELYAVHGRPPGDVSALLGITTNAVYISKTRVLKLAREIHARRIEEET